MARGNWRYRLELRRHCELGPYFVTDIGMSVVDAMFEGAKPFQAFLETLDFCAGWNQAHPNQNGPLWVNRVDLATSSACPVPPCNRSIHGS